MSEIKKNIETCRGEDVLAEVSGLPQDPHFGSLVNEAFDAPQQQALHQAGYDGYSEVIAQHKPYTFASAIIQMKSNLLLLLRALWQYPFGSGTLRSLSDAASLRSLSDDASLRSLSDMWQHYITRLSGNPEHGIPSRLSSLTDLPSAPLLLADRKISGVPDASDGISLIRLLNDDANITTLTDNTEGWMLSKNNLVLNLARILTSMQDITFNCESITTTILGSTSYGEMQSRSMILRFPKAKTIPDGLVVGSEYATDNFGYTEAHLDAIETTNQTANTHGSFKVDKLYMPNYKQGVYRQGGSAFYNNPITVYMEMGCKGAKTELTRVWSYVTNNVADFVIADGACMSITLTGFDNLTAENMYNHILCRLKQDEAGCGSGVTITLGSTNIAKLEAVEEYNTLLTELEDVYGYTFA